MLNLFLIQALNGVQLGILLFLVAAGLTLIFGVMDLINLAHGALYMIGAYLAATLTTATGSFGLGLLLALPATLVFGLARTGRSAFAAPAVGAYIGAAYWFTSSTAFANPAVTIGRTVTDTFAGIAPASAPGFVAAQVVGLAVGAALTLALFPAGADVSRR